MPYNSLVIVQKQKLNNTGNSKLVELSWVQLRIENETNIFRKVQFILIWINTTNFNEQKFQKFVTYSKTIFYTNFQIWKVLPIFQTLQWALVNLAYNEREQLMRLDVWHRSFLRINFDDWIRRE